MSSSDTTPAQKYYDPAEVETYVRDVTNTIRTLQARLQEALQRADQAEQQIAPTWTAPSGHAGPVTGSSVSVPGDYHPETASLGRALLLAGEVADKTIADAEARAADIIRAADDRAAGIVEAAHADAHRLVETAGGTAAEMFQKGEARLLAAVGAFVEGSNVLRSALARIEEDATSWRSALRQPQSRPQPQQPRPAQAPMPQAATPPPSTGHYATEAPQDTSPPRPGAPEQQGGSHNRASRNGFHAANPSAGPTDRQASDRPDQEPPARNAPPTNITPPPPTDRWGAAPG